MASRSGHQQQQQQQWCVLKCPRCESSDTKFCYYNNYSLSQPRHFCKACKRYWTRGGTLRNVPVGGGCRRKNKHAKKPGSSVRSVLDAAPSSIPHPTAQPDQIMNMPSFYGLPSNPYHIGLPHVFSSGSASNLDTLLRFDHLSDLGGLPYNSSGFDSTKQTLTDVVSISNPLLSSYNSTVAPLLLHPQKSINGSHILQQSEQVPNHFQTLLPFGNQLQTHQHGNGEEAGSGMKLKAEGNQNDQISFSDPSLYTVWNDPADVGFSVSSLI